MRGASHKSGEIVCVGCRLDSLAGAGRVLRVEGCWGDGDSLIGRDVVWVIKADVTVMGTLLHSTCKESFLGAPQAKNCGRFSIAQRPGMALKIKQ